MIRIDVEIGRLGVHLSVGLSHDGRAENVVPDLGGPLDSMTERSWQGFGFTVPSEISCGEVTSRGGRQGTQPG